MSRKLTIEEAAEYTGYKERVMRDAIKRQDLSAERPGGFERGRLYFDPAELDRWLTSIKVGSE
ncbi:MULTISPECIES: helix-turn-helix domain-containing protein [unclassified Pseudonocardia]|uniref:helix-turn-helix domain-containing protein n=1 Tax=unclassified Pseudonocardia TaxID=2619320 RepID=UPI0001FFEC3F|nr:helix-turn-helix domain-containing protein [Pseudonocardia sp. Ae707_Ps1]OLM21304.1 hypothetical protein Ae707Ps1_5563 [Pseudonocardia sp. Ae707_Ps1]